MLTYPSNLPLPDYGSYIGTIDVGLVRTSVPNANAAQFINANAPTTEISMTFTGNRDLIFEWQLWALGQGYQYFWLPVVSSATPTNITSLQRCRFISNIHLQKVGDDRYSATVQAEIVPGDWHQ